MQPESVFHTILATDVENGDGNALTGMRSDLGELLAVALAGQNIDLATLPRVGGDGHRLLLPGHVAPHALLQPFVGRLGAELRRHRAENGDRKRLRIRVALHLGLLYREPSGAYTGRQLKESGRLLGAPAGRELLAASPEADLVVLLSNAFHHEVVAGGRSLDPGWFRRVPIRVRETDGHGWAWVPGAATAAEGLRVGGDQHGRR